MKLKCYLFLSLLTLSTFPLIAQDEVVVPLTQTVSDEPVPAKKQYYFLSPRVSVTVPHPTANSSFKKSFVGIYEVSGGMNVYLYKGFFLGLSGKTGLLKITENKIADYNASMAFNQAGGKIGGDFYVGEMNRAVFSAAVSFGKNWTKYSGLKHKDPARPPKVTAFNTTYFEPEINIFFLIEANFGIGATVSYTAFNTNFDPYDLSLNEYSRFGSDNTGTTQFYSFGLGFYYSLINKKK